MATFQQQRQQQRSPATSARSTASSVSSETPLSASILHRKSELVQTYYDDAKRFISKALEADKNNSRMSALEFYNKALGAIQGGLGMIRHSSTVNKTLLELRGKMEKLKDQVKSRMEVLIEQETAARKPGSQSSTVIPSAPTQSVVMANEGAIGGLLQGREGETVTEADMIFSTSGGARMFYVDSSGRVSQCSQPEPLFIFKYRKRIAGQPPAFVQCGDFIYPLIPGKSPILRRNGYKVYMFPELEGEEGGSTGLLLRSVPEEELEELDHMFSVLADLKVTEGVGTQSTAASVSTTTVDSTTSSHVQPLAKTKEEEELKEKEKEEHTWGATVSGTITAGVSWLSGVLAQGTEAAGGLLIKGGDKIRGEIEPNEKPTDIPQPVKVGAHYARKVSGGIVGVSDFLMVSLAKATVAVGKKVGSVVAESDMVKGRQINPHAKEAWKVTKSTVKGAGQVFVDLERSAVAVIRATGKEASKTVGHKYGEQAETVVDDSLGTAGHVANLTATYWSWKTWGIRFVTRVGGVLAGDQESKTEKTPQVTDAPRPHHQQQQPQPSLT